MEDTRRMFHFDWVGKMWWFLGISAILIVASIALVATKGLNFGTDFAGGYEIQVKFPEDVTETQIRDQLGALKIDFQVQRYGSVQDRSMLILVRKNGTMAPELRQAVEKDFQDLAGGPDNLINWSMAESGENMIAGFAKPTSEEELRKVLAKYDLQVKHVTHGGRDDQPEYAVQLVSLADKIEGALRTGFKIAPEWDLVPRVEFVGPQVGEQLRNQGVMAVVFSFFFIMLYVAIRFDIYFAPGAVISLIHDTVITVGFISLIGIEFNLTVVAGLLTLIGYSINDTIVVYDRIRENVVRLRGRELRSMVNTSMNETFSRTILTSLLTWLVVVALAIFGGEVLRPFSLTMLFGIVIGTYSSVYVASPFYIIAKERFQKRSGAEQVAAG